MVREMDPERRRKLVELARWHSDWQARHGVDDAEVTPFGADSPQRRRPPTAAQEHEFLTRADEIMGYDPQTGRHLGELTRPRPARTEQEAHAYLDRRPCFCGERSFNRSVTVVPLPDGGQAHRFAGVCPRCGQPREFVFRFPVEPLPDTGEFRYGGDEQSKLLDPGEWLLVAEEQMAAVPGDPERLPDTQQRQARARLVAAAAAIDEVLKFVPPGAAAVPADANWSEWGDSLYREEPDRFQVAALVTARDSLRRQADRLAA